MRRRSSLDRRVADRLAVLATSPALALSVLVPYRKMPAKGKRKRRERERERKRKNLLYLCFLLFFRAVHVDWRRRWEGGLVGGPLLCFTARIFLFLFSFFFFSSFFLFISLSLGFLSGTGWPGLQFCFVRPSVNTCPSSPSTKSQ